MNRWLLIHRLRWPAFVILFGITALLNQWGVMSFGRSWPLYLILAGLLMLAERAALSVDQPPPFPGQNFGQPQSYGAPGGLHAQLPDSGASSSGISEAGNGGPGDDPSGGN
jgi:Domain of unknown function (DUF5668)